jgi:hypothetical protein
METATRQIVAFGSGGFSMESDNPLLGRYVLGLAKGERPRVCFLLSASGDADHYVVRFYRAFPAERCEASHVSLFRREQGPDDLRGHLLSQDYERGTAHGLAYHDQLRAGMRAGYTAQDGAALRFVGTELRRVVASRPASRAFWLNPRPSGVAEAELETTYLGGEPAQPSETAVIAA